MAIIKLSTGSECLIDDDDLPLVAGITWLEHQKGERIKRLYVRGWCKLTQRNVYMHRQIVEPPVGYCVDHINGNCLDNRRANLRVCTLIQNNGNARWPVGRSGYRGVTVQGKSYMASISIHDKKKHLGTCTDPVTAAKLYDQAALAYFGEFATLNFPIKGA